MVMKPTDIGSADGSIFAAKTTIRSDKGTPTPTPMRLPPIRPNTIDAIMTAVILI